MANLDLLMRSLEFIEEHLEDPIPVQTEDIAAACFASKSSLEKVFKYTIRFSVHDYIIRRKMTRAARMMIEKPALSILDIAVQFGYSSHEAFTRTFSQVWNCNPSDFKKRYTETERGHTAELFPKITGFIQLEGEPFMRRTVDISELYDFLSRARTAGLYVVTLFTLSRSMKFRARQETLQLPKLFAEWKAFAVQKM